jgi:hypothetical protein
MYTRPEQATLIALLIDSEYHKALLAVSIELVRFTYQLREFWDTEKIIQGLKTSWFQFTLIASILLSSQNWVPYHFRNIQLTINSIKRLKHLESKILDTHVWNDDDFFKMIAYKHTNIKPPSHELFRFYYCVLKPKNEQKEKWFDIHTTIADHILENVLRVTQCRLEDLRDDLGFDQKLLDKVFLNNLTVGFKVNEKHA